jgi:steroid 5-alpha reductase family enzyme
MPVFDLNLYLAGLVAALLLPLLTWIVSLLKGDVSIVDSLWSIIFLALCVTWYIGYEFTTLRGVIVFALVGFWALRLSAYITWRNWGEDEDPRYQDMRRRFSPHFAIKSLFVVFLLQGFLAWIIALPLLAAITGSRPPNLFDGLAAMLVLFGVLFESIADAQLAAFKSKAGNRGRVMDKGLWRYTRHPNYFGECCVWWGFYLFAVAAGGWWSVLSPVLMTFLLLRVSGVTLLEKDITERRPGYRNYVERTNAFIPGLPRNTGTTVTQ